MSKKAEQEYLLDREYVVIKHQVEGDNDLVVVAPADGYGGYSVATRSQLTKKEDSYYYKRAQERADELRLITAKAEEKFEEITEKVIKAACSALSTRMKMNMLFGKDMGANGWAIAIADELNKLVREKTPSAIKDDDFPDIDL